MSAKPLDQLTQYERYQIQEITTNQEFGDLDAIVGQRLADLGFGAGQTVEVIGRGIFGVGPYAVRLGNQSQFTLRRAEARKVVCVPVQAA